MSILGVLSVKVVLGLVRQARLCWLEASASEDFANLESQRA